nr:odorant-binding protein 18 [Lytta caraganae]
MMNYAFVFLLFLSLSSIKADDLEDSYHDHIKCFEENQLTLEDYRKFMKPNVGEVPENFACAIKCVMEDLEIIGTDGSINADNIENCPFMSKLKDGPKTMLKECYAKIDKIGTCQDMYKVTACFDAVAATFKE